MDNIEIVNKLNKVYEAYSEKYITVYNEIHKSKPITHFIKYGLVSEGNYKQENGILFVARETNGEFEASFLPWLHEIALKRDFYADSHVRKHPQIWYNISRWIEAIIHIMNKEEFDLEEIGWMKKDILKNLDFIAYTNISKGYGKDQVDKEFWEMAYTDISLSLLGEEIKAIEPKVIVCCNTYDAVVKAAERQSVVKPKILNMCHPSARNISKKEMLNKICIQMGNNQGL